MAIAAYYLYIAKLLQCWQRKLVCLVEIEINREISSYLQDIYSLLSLQHHMQVTGERAHQWRHSPTRVACEVHRCLQL